MGSGETKDVPSIPELASEYEFVRELGRGGTAVVYLARDRELGREVAIKLLRPSALRDEDALARLIREARTAARLQHPNIVMLLGARRLSRGELALLLQYVPGVTLKERIRTEGPLPFAETEAILREMASALDFAHRLQIVHRDVKPDNIYLDRAVGISRLADFGIARVWDVSSGLTLPGMAIGTPTYMSPEQVEGAALDGRSDLYSLGLVGWEMLTGCAPWDGEGMYSVIYKQKTEQLPSILEFRPDVPEHLRLGIERLLAKDPNDRWATAEAFSAALRARAPVLPRAYHPVPEPASRRLLKDLPPLVMRAGSPADSWPRLRAVVSAAAHRLAGQARTLGANAAPALRALQAAVRPRLRVASSELRSRTMAGFDAIPSEVRGFLLPAFLLGAAAVLALGSPSGGGEAPPLAPPSTASMASGGMTGLGAAFPGDHPPAFEESDPTDGWEARLRSHARRAWNESQARAARVWNAVTTQASYDSGGPPLRP